MSTEDKPGTTAGHDSSRATELRDAAYDLAREQGLAMLSARSLSRVTGTRPAAINYYFGHREALIAEITGCAMQASHQWRTDHAKIDPPRDAPGWSDLDHAITHLIQSRLSTGRHLLALIHELEHESAAIRPALIRETEHDAAFWRDLAGDHGESAEAAEAWASLAIGLTGLLLSDGDAGRRSAWISAPAERLRRRIQRLPVRLIQRGGPDAQAMAMTPAGSDTARAILDSTLALIGSTGPDRLQLREVALGAGVSVAAVTYFFHSKGDLVRAAFAELCRRHCLTLPDAGTPTSPQAIEDMLSFHDQAGLQGLAAMETMLRAASRSPELVPTATLIRQVRGVASLVLLRKLGLEVDHLDAYLWACLLTGRYRTIRFLPIEQQQQHLDAAARGFLATVFGWNGRATVTG
jgi:AcrR family transcriptional regulator